MRAENYSVARVAQEDHRQSVIPNLDGSGGNWVRTETLDCLYRARKLYTLDSIARYLGLHKNTTARWIEQKKVPQHYLPDLRRILGEGGHDIHNSDSTVKDKDQYYTKPETAEWCYNIFLSVAKKLEVDLTDYCFIEPSAGCGHFYNLLPLKRKIGIDIDSGVRGILKADFLQWTPSKKRRYIVIGNPPFGLRGHLALQFINHAYDFADMVAFVLPQLFASDGKGVPAKRVRGYVLASSVALPANSFSYPDGSSVDIHTLFQVWTKVGTKKVRRRTRKTARSYIKIYSLSNGGTPSSTRNKAMIGHCDVYIPSTCYTGMRAYSSFSELPNQRGYGILIHKKKREIKNLLFAHDWMQSAFASTNSAINMRSSLIEDVVTQGGYYDE